MPVSRLGALLDRSIVFSFDRTGFRRHQRAFPTEPERDLHGRDVLITGGTAGIGASAVQELVQRGARVTTWARNATRGQQAADSLGAAFTAVDLGDLEQVATAARTYAPEALAAVVLNAGAMPLERTLTAAGHELIWASQVLGHLLIVRVLHARGLLGPETRVIWVSSGGMYAQRLDLRDLTWAHGYQRHTVYANAKRAQVMLGEHLSERWPEVPMAVMHPGWVQTEAVKHSMPLFHALTRPILRTPAEGADTIVWLVAREQTPASGQFWFDRSPQPTHLRSATHAPPEDRAALVAQVFADTNAWLPEETE